MAAAIQQRQRDELHRRIWQIANDVLLTVGILNNTF